jgi:hypothetical protein
LYLILRHMVAASQLRRIKETMQTFLKKIKVITLVKGTPSVAAWAHSEIVRKSFTIPDNQAGVS